MFDVGFGVGLRYGFLVSVWVWIGGIGVILWLRVLGGLV